MLRKMKEGIINFKNDVGKTIGILCPIFALIISVVIFVNRIRDFANEGNFHKQANFDMSMKMSERFTIGTVPDYYADILMMFISLIFMLGFVAIIISVVKNLSFKEDLFLLISAIGVTFFVFALTFGMLIYSWNTYIFNPFRILVDLFEKVKSYDWAMYLVSFLFTIFVICLIMFLIELKRVGSIWMIPYYVLIMSIIYIILPLLLLLIENIVSIFVVVAIFIFLLFVLGIMIAGLAGRTDGNTENVRQNEEVRDSVKVKNNIKVIPYDRDVILYVEKSSTNGYQYIHPYGKTAFSNEYNDPIHEHIDLNDFKNGKVIIKIKGKVATTNDLYYKK